MNTKEELLQLIEAKNQIIYEFTEIKYINNNDLADIDKWKTDELEYVLSELKNALEDGLGLRENTCPWCILMKYRCHAVYEQEICHWCPYGEHHRICEDKDSLYQKIRGRLTKQDRILLEQITLTDMQKDLR